MVRNHDDGSVAIFLGEIHGYGHGLVESIILGNNSHRVIAVSRIIHLAALHHKEKSVLVLGKQRQCLLRHFTKRRLCKSIPVQVESHILAGEQRPYRSLFHSPERRNILFNVSDAVVLQYGLHIIIHIIHATAENDIHAVGSHLPDNIVMLAPGDGMRRSCARCRMCCGDGHDQSSGLVSENLGSFHYRGKRLPSAVCIDIDKVLSFIL